MKGKNEQKANKIEFPVLFRNLDSDFIFENTSIFN
jgi:hypothetical protein